MSILENDAIYKAITTQLSDLNFIVFSSTCHNLHNRDVVKKVITSYGRNPHMYSKVKAIGDVRGMRTKDTLSKDLR